MRLFRSLLLLLLYAGQPPGRPYCAARPSSPRRSSGSTCFMSAIPQRRVFDMYIIISYREVATVTDFATHLYSRPAAQSLGYGGGTTLDVSITANRRSDPRHKSEDEVRGLRLWSGARWLPT